MPEQPPTPLRDIAAVFLKLGTIGFGGPAAHIAMMEDEVVHRRRWLTREQFLDYLGATNLIPGPNSTELAIHVGHSRAGWPGLLVAGACFILPAALIVTLFGWMYVRFGRLPEVGGVLAGVKAVVIAIVVQALWRLGRSALKTVPLGVVAAVATAVYVAGVNELAVLAGCGLAAAALRSFAGGSQQQIHEKGAPAITLAIPTTGAVTGTAAVTSAFGLWPLFWFFVKVGSVLFGSGYVLLAFLRSGLVVERGWLTESQLLDAIAVGQITPGPVFTTATFVGYLLAGGVGAAVATFGIFLPAFVFVALSGPLVPRIRRSPTAAAVLDGVNAGSLALMAVVTYQLGRSALVDWVSILLVVGSIVVLFGLRVNSAWLVAAGAVVGLARP